MIKLYLHKLCKFFDKGYKKKKNKCVQDCVFNDSMVSLSLVGLRCVDCVNDDDDVCLLYWSRLVYTASEAEANERKAKENAGKERRPLVREGAGVGVDGKSWKSNEGGGGGRGWGFCGGWAKLLWRTTVGGRGGGWREGLSRAPFRR